MFEDEDGRTDGGGRMGDERAVAFAEYTLASERARKVERGREGVTRETACSTAEVHRRRRRGAYGGYFDATWKNGENVRTDRRKAKKMPGSDEHA